ncbi:MAG: calcium-binding protein [Myxococcaceae bacterium]|nr:calcium-binding protein [Myxococcaceae bacterium]
MRLRLLCAVLLVPLVFIGCTDAGLYATNGRGPSGPDRAELEGDVCVPLASGDSFPVRVLFAFPGGAGVLPEVEANLSASLQSLETRFSFPYIRFSLVAYHTVATGIVGQFVESSDLVSLNAAQKYEAYNEAGNVSLRAPLRLAESILSGDMQTGCRGLVARTRYLVVLVITDADRSCSTPAFNTGILDDCANQYRPQDDPDTERLCATCELRNVTGQVRALEDKYRAGEVSVQPIYVRTSPDPLIVEEASAIARAGGTQLIQTDPASLKNVLNSLNYASLQRELRLKRLIALNINALARQGQLLVDSDSDGLADEDETARESDPFQPDSDGDGISDGIETRMGMDPLTFDTIHGCNPLLDTDFDRVNDCEERVIGTDACISDSDGDTLPDWVELLAGTNPLLPEDLTDSDRDGVPNVDEVTAHTDPFGADLSWRDDHAYGYDLSPAPPTDDGRACYHVRIRNVGLVSPPVRPNPPYSDIPAGRNDLFIYVQVGRDNDPRGTGIGSLASQEVTFLPPATRDPEGVLPLTPDDFVVGN